MEHILKYTNNGLSIIENAFLYAKDNKNTSYLRDEIDRGVASLKNAVREIEEALEESGKREVIFKEEADYRFIKDKM